MTAHVETRGLSRWYGPILAVQDVSLALGPGVWGLLGPNGSGKSTLLAVLAGQMRPSKGDVRVLGERPWQNPALFAKVGLCPEHDALYDDLTGRELLGLLLELHGYARGEADARAVAAMTEVGLEESMDRAVGGYSRGMRQRVKIAQAFAHDPEVLLLDEPLAGTDPLSRAKVIERIRARGEAGACVIVSSHVLHEVEAMTDRIALILKGRLIAEGNLFALRDLLEDHPHQIRIECSDPRALAKSLVDLPAVEAVKFVDRVGLEIHTREPQVCYREAPKRARAAGIKIRALTSPDASLEAVFRYLVEGKHVKKIGAEAKP